MEWLDNDRIQIIPPKKPKKAKKAKKKSKK